jgi:hypothetical protein
MELQSESDDEPSLLHLQSGEASSVSQASHQLELEPDSPGMELECDEDVDGGFTPAPNAFQWAVTLIKILEEVVGTRALRARFERPMSYCSHFSGLGTAEVAMDCIKALHTR